MATTIAEPGQIQGSAITPETERNFAMLVYQKAQEGAGLKKLELVDFHSYMNWNSFKVDNVAKYAGCNSDDSDFPDWDQPSAEDLPTGVISLKERIDSLSTQLGISSGSVTPPAETMKTTLDRLNNEVDSPSDPSLGLMSRVPNLEERTTNIENYLGTGLEPIEGSVNKRITDIEDIVGEPAHPEADPPTGATGLCAEVANIHTQIGNESTSGTILYRMKTNEDNIAANTSSISGQGDRIIALEDVVGNDTISGTLVYNVAEINNFLGNTAMPTDPTTGDPRTVSQQVDINTHDIKNIRETISTAYVYKGSIASVTTPSGQDTTSITLTDNTVISINDLKNGWVFNVNATPSSGITIVIGGTEYPFPNGINIAWVKHDSGSATIGEFDELGTNIDVAKIDELDERISAIEQKSGSTKIDSRGWNSIDDMTNFEEGIYQFTYNVKPSGAIALHRLGVFVLPMSKGPSNTGLVSNLASITILQESESNFITDNFSIDVSSQSELKAVSTARGTLSWTKIGEIDS